MEVIAVTQTREDDKEVVRSGNFVDLYFSNYTYYTDWMWGVREQRGVKDNSKVFGLSNYKVEIWSCQELNWEMFWLQHIFRGKINSLVLDIQAWSS